MLAAQIGEIKRKVTVACYMSGDAAAFVEEARPDVQKIVETTGQNTYIAGDNVTYLDFIWFETLEAINFVGNDVFYNEHPQLSEYRERII